jgi:hypothetical protein
MTYGWAILIIAVVLGALFQLGVFNANNFAPKAPPGACQVFRPNGPYTTSFINLEGECQGELPQYAALGSGQNSYIFVGNSSLFNPPVLTIVAWAKPLGKPGYCSDAGIVNKNWNGGNNETWLLTMQQCNSSYKNNIYFGGFVVNTTTDNEIWLSQPANPSLQLGTWYFVAFEYNGSYELLFVNGLEVGSRKVLGPIVNHPQVPVGIGFRKVFTKGVGGYSINNLASAWRSFNGSIANVQIYNTSLSPSEIQALYQEGIGGAPIDLQNLVGWWPLNGNANDYSGNGNNGVPNGVTFTSNWWSGYTPP